MSKWRMPIVPLFLLGQTLLVYWAISRERPPTPPDLVTFPPAFGNWRQLVNDPIAADVASELHADQLLSRTYVNALAGSVASLFVAWFQSQRAGTNQPHSPKVCLPASGWTPAVTGQLTLQTADGAITINRYIVVKATSAMLFCIGIRVPAASRPASGP